MYTQERFLVKHFCQIDEVLIDLVLKSDDDQPLLQQELLTLWMVLPIVLHQEFPPSVRRSCHSFHWWSQCGELHHVELSDHVEDEDDEKCCCQLKLNRSQCCWTVGSNVLCCLVLKCNGISGTPWLWSCWRLTRACVEGLYCSLAHNGPAWGMGSTLLMWSKLSQRCCRLGATWLLSIMEMQSRYLMHVSVHSIATWDARYVAFFLPSALYRGVVAASFRSSFASTALAWSICPWLCPHFSLLTELFAVRQYGVFKDANVALIKSIVLWLVRSQTLHGHMFNPSGTCFRQEGHWIVAEVCLSSVNSRLPIS